MAPRPLTGIALALVCLGLLGVMPVIANGRPEGFSALSFACFLSLWQLVFAVPLFLRGLSGADRGIFGTAIDGRERRRVVLVTIVTGVMFALATLLYVIGVRQAGAVSAAIAIQAYPLFAIAWEALFLGRRKTPAELACTAVLLGALFHLGTGGTWRIDGFSPWFLLALGVPFLWSIAHVIIKEELGRTPLTPAQVTFLRVLVSAVFLAAVLAVVDPGRLAADFRRWDFQSFALAMGLVYYLELIIWFHAVRHIDVSLASSITTPWPALTMVLAATLLGDTVTGQEIGAFLVVAASLYALLVLSLRKTRARGAAVASRTDR